VAEKLGRFDGRVGVTLHDLEAERASFIADSAKTFGRLLAELSHEALWESKTVSDGARKENESYYSPQPARCSQTESHS
jgi:hypothetical protein